MMGDGNMKESYDLLKEALNERNYFLNSAPFMNHQLKIIIPHNSFLWTSLWYFPAVIFYHTIYLLSQLKTHSDQSIKGPSLYSPFKMRR